MDYFFSGKYNFSWINIDGIEVNRYSKSTGRKPAKDSRRTSSLSELDEINVDEILIENGNYVHQNITAGVTDSINNFFISLQDVVFDSTLNFDKIISILTKAELKAQQAHYHFTDMLYELKFNDLIISSNGHEASANDISFQPYLNDFEFFAGKRFRSDRFKASVKNFNCTGIDFKKLQEDKILSVDNLSIKDFLFDALTNMRLPENLYSAPPEMPNEVVNSLPFFLNLRKAELLNGNIFVKELYPYDDNPAVLRFGNVNASASNITKGETAVINVSSLLMGKGKLDVAFKIGLEPEKMHFSYKGTLDSLNAAELNSFIKIAERVEISSGQIHHVDYQVSADGDSAMAESTPVYSDLKIKNLDEETGSSSGIAELFSSFIANVFVIKENNGIDETPESSKILYVKKNDDAFMEYVWISLRKALGKIAGFD